MLNLAIVGLKEGLSALRAAHQLPEWQIHTLCGLDEPLLKQRQADYEFDATLTTLLADPDIDAVALFTPDDLHAGISEGARTMRTLADLARSC